MLTKVTMFGKYQTKDGRPVRILCVDANGERPVVGIIVNDSLKDAVYRWTCYGLKADVHGEYSRECGMNLIPAPDLVPLESKDVYHGCVARSRYSHNKDAWAPIYPNDQCNFNVGNIYGLTPNDLMRDYEIKYPGKTIWEPCSKVKGS